MLHPLRRKRLQRLFGASDGPAFARAWLDAARLGESPDDAAPEPLLDEWSEFRLVAVRHHESLRAGHVYVAAYLLANDVFKVGMSRTRPEERVKSLRTAGVLAPLLMIHAEAVPDRYAAESIAHRVLDTLRVEREFFAVKADQVITCVQGIAARERALFRLALGRL